MYSLNKTLFELTKLSDNFKKNIQKTFAVNRMSRSYKEELEFIEKINDHSWRIKKGFVPNMNVKKKELIYFTFLIISKLSIA